MLPYAGGLVVVGLIAFAMYVRSVPPYEPPPRPKVQQFPGGAVPEFMHVDTEPIVKQAQAQDAADTEPATDGGDGGEAAAAGAPDDLPPKAEGAETIEL